MGGVISSFIATFAQNYVNINYKFIYMKKILLSIAAVFLTLGAMAQTTNIVKFTFARTGTGLTDIPVNVTVNDVATNNITASLSASATGVASLMNLSDNSIVCFANEGSGNSSAATESAPHIYTLTINGLDGETLKNISIANKALTGSGDWQGTSVNRQRHYNVSSGTSTENLTLVEDRIDLISVTGTMGDIERAKDFVVDNVEIGTTLVIQLKMYNASDITGDEALGCFYGLTGFTLTTEVVEPEPTPVADFYHPGNKNLTATELMSVTKPTYIAIKGLANKNNEYWNYVSGDANTSTEYFNQNAIFVWEPVNNGVAGSYYLRKLNSGYMQTSNPGAYAETTEGAAVFTAVKPTEVASGANGSEQFNKDANSVGFIAAAGGYDYTVRFVTNGKWLNIGDRLTSAQAPAFNNGYGTFTIYQICELKGFEANINVTIKNTGDVDFATFYSNAPVQMPEGVTAYYVKEEGINDGLITLAADEDGIIAGNTGVILSTTADADAEVALTVLGANVAAENGNLLKGTAEDTVINEAAYVLGIAEGVVGLYKASTTGQAEGTFLNNAGKAYLPASAVPAAAQGAANFSFRFEGEGTTGVEEVKTENGNVKTVYDLTGRRVEAITAPGIYIVNGKKVLVK